MSPKNLHIFVDFVSVVVPDAPTQIRIGKIRMIQNDS